MTPRNKKSAYVGTCKVGVIYTSSRVAPQDVIILSQQIVAWDRIFSVPGENNIKRKEGISP